MSRLQEKKQQTSVSTLPSSVGGTRIDPPLTLNRSEGLGTDCSLTLVGRTGLGRAAHHEQFRAAVATHGVFERSWRSSRAPRVVKGRVQARAAAPGGTGVFSYPSSRRGIHVTARLSKMWISSSRARARLVRARLVLAPQSEFGPRSRG
jgi:hypothetical protein